MDNSTNQKKNPAPKNFLELLKESPLQAQKERFFQRFSQEQGATRSVERLIFHQAEQETKLQIQALQAELKKLAESTGKLTREVAVAVSQPPIHSGPYHVSFLEKLRYWLVLLKKRIDESTTWLSEFNQRSKKKNYYWSQVKKSGTKFMLSQERYMTNQAG